MTGIQGLVCQNTQLTCLLKKLFSKYFEAFKRFANSEKSFFQAF